MSRRWNRECKLKVLLTVKLAEDTISGSSGKQTKCVEDGEIRLGGIWSKFF